MQNANWDFLKNKLYTNSINDFVMFWFYNLGSISAPARDEQQSPDANQQPTRKILGYNQKDQEVDSELEKPLA